PELRRGGPRRACGAAVRALLRAARRRAREIPGSDGGRAHERWPGDPPAGGLIRVAEALRRPGLRGYTQTSFLPHPYLCEGGPGPTFFSPDHGPERNRVGGIADDNREQAGRARP